MATIFVVSRIGKAWLKLPKTVMATMSRTPPPPHAPSTPSPRRDISNRKAPWLCWQVCKGWSPSRWRRRCPAIGQSHAANVSFCFLIGRHVLSTFPPFANNQGSRGWKAHKHGASDEPLCRGRNDFSDIRRKSWETWEKKN